MHERDILELKQELRSSIRGVQRQLDYLTEWVIKLEQSKTTTIQIGRYQTCEDGHTQCDDPAICDCECRVCKSAWNNAGRPSPKSVDSGA